MITVEQTASPQERSEYIRLLAGGYLVYHLGDQLWAGEPTYDETAEQWIVSIHARSLPKQTVLGQMRLDASGNVVQVPTENEVLAALRTHAPPELKPVRGPLLMPPFQLGFAAKSAEEQQNGEAPPVPDEEEISAEQMVQMMQELAADPRLYAVWNKIRAAYANPIYRDAIEEAAAAFANIARAEPEL